MGVIRGSNEDDIELLAVLFEDFPPIGVSGCAAPALLAEDTAPAGFVNLGESDALAAFTVGCTNVGVGTSAYGDESNLEFLVEPLGPDELREAKGARSSYGGGTLYKLTTCDV
jgi:hypothetical protein